MNLLEEKHGFLHKGNVSDVLASMDTQRLPSSGICVMEASGRQSGCIRERTTHIHIQFPSREEFR